MGPATAELAEAPALAPALKFGTGLATGIGGQPLAEKAAEKLGANPDQQKFIGELAFWAPQIAGLIASKAGVQGGIESPRGYARRRNSVWWESRRWSCGYARRGYRPRKGRAVRRIKNILPRTRASPGD